MTGHAMAHDATTQHATPNHERVIDLESLSAGEILAVESRRVLVRVESVNAIRRFFRARVWSPADRKFLFPRSFGFDDDVSRPTPSELKSLHDAGAFAAAKEARS